jgi:hypothetical protein
MPRKKKSRWIERIENAANFVKALNELLLQTASGCRHAVSIAGSLVSLVCMVFLVIHPDILYLAGAGAGAVGALQGLIKKGDKGDDDE